MHGTYNGGGDYKVPRPIIISHSGQPGQLGQRELPISDCSGRGDHGIRGIHGTYNAARDSLALDGEALAEAQRAQRLAGRMVVICLARMPTQISTMGAILMLLLCVLCASARDSLAFDGEALAEARRARRLAGRMVVICLARMPAQISTMGCHW